MSNSFALGTLVTTLGINTKPINTAEKELTTFAGKTNAIMSSVRRTMATVFAAVSVGKLAKGFLDAAVSVENYKVSLNAVVKDARKTEAVFQDLFKWAAINPIDTDDAIKSFVRLKTAGIENTRAAVAAAADAATVMQKPVEYVANAMVSTNNKMLRQIGIQLDRTGKMAIIRSGKVRLEVTKDLDSIRQGIIEVLQKNFKGAMESYQHTWRGALNTMKGLWWTFMTEVMGTSSSGGPYETLVEGINRVKDAWIAWRNSADYGEFVAKIQSVFSAVIESMITGITLLVKAFKWMIDHIELVSKAIMIWVSAKVMGAAINTMIAFKANLALGSEALTLFARLVYKVRLAILEFRTATTIVEGLKGAILALGLGPGGVVFIAITALIALAVALEDMFGDAATGVRTFNAEFAKVDTAKLKEMAKITGPSLGGMGLGGNWKAGVAAAERDIINQMIATNSWRNKMKDDYTGIHAKVKEPVGEIPGLDGASGESKFKKMLQRMKDEAKYLGANVKDFLPTLDAWAAKMKPLSEDWKLIKDYAMEIRTSLAKDAGQEAADNMKRLEEQIKLQEEAKKSAEEGVERFWSKVATGFQQGLVQGTEYFTMLQNEFNRLKESLATESGGFLNVDDMFNWTDAMMQRFSELQSIGEHLVSLDLTRLTDQLDKGVITKKEWIRQVEILIEKYKESPSVVKVLSDAIEDVADKGISNAKELEKAFEGWASGFASQLNDILWKSDVTFNDIAVSFAKMITEMIIQLTIIKPLMTWLTGIFGGGGVFTKGFAPAIAPGGSPYPGLAYGGVVSNGALTKYARGGLVNKPTLFPMAGGMGLMGEAGPEAVMPLKRGPDGKLGVVNTDKDKGEGTTNITMNINAVDAQSFVQMLKTNKATVQALVVDSLYKNGQVRKAIKGTMQ